MESLPHQGPGISISKLIKVTEKIKLLRNAGNVVEEQDIPGLWRINGGPELTTNQLLSINAVNLRIEL